MVDVTVRGAGIFGLSVAWACVLRGASVRVVDPAGPAAGASGGIVGALALFAVTALAPAELAGHLTVFVLAIVIGFYVIGNVHHALHTPLMAVTNAISSVIIVGALIASAEAGSDVAKWLGLAAVVLASINIFGGFAVTERMLAMYKKKEKKLFTHEI